MASGAQRVPLGFSSGPLEAEETRFARNLRVVGTPRNCHQIQRAFKARLFDGCRVRLVDHEGDGHPELVVTRDVADQEVAPRVEVDRELLRGPGGVLQRGTVDGGRRGERGVDRPRRRFPLVRRVVDLSAGDPGAPDGDLKRDRAFVARDDEGGLLPNQAGAVELSSISCPD